MLQGIYSSSSPAIMKTVEEGGEGEVEEQYSAGTANPRTPNPNGTTLPLYEHDTSSPNSSCNASATDSFHDGNEDGEDDHVEVASKLGTWEWDPNSNPLLQLAMLSEKLFK